MHCHAAGDGVLVIRADGGGRIGVGHIVRSSAIAREAVRCGFVVVYAVADDESAGLAKSAGFDAVVVGGGKLKLGCSDGLALAELSAALGAQVVLVDSYAVTDDFFAAIQDQGLYTVYMDDAYTFEGGIDGRPQRRPVDCVINYSFGFSVNDYRTAYADAGAKLLIGPAYAPVRNSFVGLPYEISEDVGRILVTSGSTNPEGALERMVAGCLKACSDARIDVVVGGMAEFNVERFTGCNLGVHRGLDDLSGLMLAADIAVAAAGSTLYELCCIGVPTVALPIVENQVSNAYGYASAVASIESPGIRWDVDDVAYAVGLLMCNKAARAALSERCREYVDGSGAARIARELVRSADIEDARGR